MRTKLNMNVSFEPKKRKLSRIIENKTKIRKDFKKGKNSSSSRPNYYSAGTVDAYLHRISEIRTSFVQPIRQTTSIFKQSVTIFRNHDSKVKNNLENDEKQEKPKQLFWERRLKSLFVSDMEDHAFGKNSLFKPNTGQTCAKSTLHENLESHRNQGQRIITIADNDTNYIRTLKAPFPDKFKK